MMLMKMMTISLEKILGVALFGRRRPDQCGLQLLHWPMLVPRPHTLLVSHFAEVRPEQNRNMGKSVTEPLVYVLVHCEIMRKTFCEEQNHLDPVGSTVRYEMMKLCTSSVEDTMRR